VIARRVPGPGLGMTDNDAFIDGRPCLHGVLEKLREEGREGEWVGGCDSSSD